MYSLINSQGGKTRSFRIAFFTSMVALFLLVAVGCSSQGQPVTTTQQQPAATPTTVKPASDITSLNEAIAADPKSGQAYVNRGFFYVRQGNAGGARRDFTTAIQYGPSLAEAYFGRALVFILDGKLETTQADCQLVHAIRPESAIDKLCQGMTLGGSNSKEAISLFVQALQIDPNSVEAHILKGSFYESVPEIQDTKVALADYSQAIALDSGCSLCYAMRGLLEHKMERKGEALTDLETYLKMVGSNPDPDLDFYNNVLQEVIKLKQELGVK